MEQWVVYITLMGMLILFVDGRWRYDVVALGALLFATLLGAVPQAEAFEGFGHPAVITVAAVLVISKGLQNGGVVGGLTRLLGRVGNRPSILVGTLTLTVALLSAFMNNVGALALIMPVAVRLARKHNLSPSILLMPLAFGSLMGGLTTLVGTPPNIVIASFRAQNTGLGTYTTFDFTPVGTMITLVGVAFVSVVGWRLVPRRNSPSSGGDLFNMTDYITEVRVLEDAKLVGKPIRELATLLDIELIILMLVRNERRFPNPHSAEVFEAGDVLVLEVDPDNLKELLETGNVELDGDEHLSEALKGSGDIEVIEAVVRPDASIRGQSAMSLNLRWRYGVNLLAVARQGTRIRSSRLIHIKFRAGDVLLLQARSAAIPDILGQLGCLPLAERELGMGKPRRLALSIGVFGVGLGLITFNLLEVQVAMSMVALLMVLVQLVSLKEAYNAIDWPIIILLGAIIPIGTALQTSGGSQEIANLLLSMGTSLSPITMLAVLIVITMLLSNIVSNVATVVLMAPIALTIATDMGVGPDAYLMGVAVGASSPFLTPIGHQSNTLVLGAGGYRFGDFWRLGLPLTLLVLATAMVMILLVWPL